MIAGSLVTDWPNRELDALVHTWQDTASQPLPLCIKKDPPQPTPRKQPIYTPTSWIKSRSPGPRLGPVDLHTFPATMVDGKRHQGTKSHLDGGWGWVIVGCCFMVTVCTRAVTRWDTHLHTQRVQIDKRRWCVSHFWMKLRPTGDKKCPEQTRTPG